MIELSNFAQIDIDNRNTAEDLFSLLFSSNIPDNILDEFIRKTFRSQRKTRAAEEDAMYSELYKLKVLDWGGFYQNNVEKTIVNNYVKKIKTYSELIEKIDNEINPKIKGYVTSSWYNHWSSIYIEDMFKEHDAVLPTTGLIKKIDFFWNDTPYDLKVTYFPEQYMSDERRKRGLPTEISKLKELADELGIPFDRTQSDHELFDELLTRIEEHPSPEAKQFITNFHKERRAIVRDTIENPHELVKWFYENQGERRFDSANRFFLVLVDLNKLEDSWKLKRNRELLKPEIQTFLSETKLSKGFNIEFTWQGNTYTAIAQIKFIINDR